MTVRKKPRAEGDTFEMPEEHPPIKLVDGLWWPEKAGGSMGRYLNHVHDSDKAIRLCDRNHRRTCIQAGGHVGTWALRLAGKFQRVITFEPEPTNWACLTRNIANTPNIEAHRGALAEKPGDAMLAFNGKNIGGSKIRKPDQVRDRDVLIPVQTLTIDDLGLTDVDFICLDIEGCELRALQGAEKTVEASKPVIMVEEWGHLLAQGHSPADLWGWLKRRGYREVAKVSHDHIWAAR